MVITITPMYRDPSSRAYLRGFYDCSLNRARTTVFRDMNSEAYEMGWADGEDIDLDEGRG